MPLKAENEATVNDHGHYDDDVDTVYFLNHGCETDTSGMHGRAIVKELRATVGTWWWKEMTRTPTKRLWQYPSSSSLRLWRQRFNFQYHFSQTFGAVYGKNTNDQIGAVEMLIATAWGGCFARRTTDVRFPRRYLLVLCREHKSHDVHDDNEEYSYTSAAFLSLILCIGTTYLAFLMRTIKFAPYFPNQFIRNTFSDLSVVIAILAWCVVANVLFSNIPVERLNVPDDSIVPTQICCAADCLTSFPQDRPDIEPYGRRSWLVNLGAVNGKPWIPFFAEIPAMLAFILVFLDDGITWHLINHPCHKITHGQAYNYDTVIIAGMIAVNSMLCLRWLVAATVRSLTHVSAMAERTEDGKILSVLETRLSHLGIPVLVLIALFVLNVLKLIPFHVLYGVFLF